MSTPIKSNIATLHSRRELSRFAMDDILKKDSSARIEELEKRK
jgi:hypothetical protein